jgi:uncharacterized protein (DUF1501 family)
MRSALDRRMFVLGGLGGLGALARPLRARLPARGEVGRTLVLLQLTGGNDGLSMLVPYADDAYRRARRETRVEDVLRIDGRVGLHPHLRGLRELLERGRLALIEGVGAPEPSRSHFRSLDLWHAADPRGRAAGAGWIGRALARLEGEALQAVVHFGATPPFALHSSGRAPVCLTPALLLAADPARSLALRASEGLASPDSPADEALALVRSRWREARQATAMLQAALDASGGRADYPASRLGRDLRGAAALIHAQLGVRVCSLELDGFDTHRDQRVRYSRLMEELDGALGAFLADLERSPAGRETIVLLFSEFGRRLAENASGGTDHGAAGLALALGVGVRGGLLGRPPSLEALDDGDPVHTTDFRGLYARCLEHVFGLAPETVLGGAFAPVPFV